MLQSAATRWYGQGQAGYQFPEAARKSFLTTFLQRRTRASLVTVVFASGGGGLESPIHAEFGRCGGEISRTAKFIFLCRVHGRPRTAAEMRNVMLFLDDGGLEDS